MPRSRQVTVRVIRTRSLGRNRGNSTDELDRKNDQCQRVESLSNNADDQTVKVATQQKTTPKVTVTKKNITGRSFRVIHPSPSSISKSATLKEPSLPHESVHSRQFLPKNLMTKINNEGQKIISASSILVPCNGKTKADAPLMIDRFPREQTNNTLSKAEYALRVNSNNHFSIGEPEDHKRQKKQRRRAGFLTTSFCIPFWALFTLLLLSATAALIVGLLSINKITAETTFSATSTTMTTTTDTTSTTTSTTSTTSTTTSTTTTTKPFCSTSCLNQTWMADTSLRAKFKFENNYLDENKQYNGTGENNPAFVAGYVGQAVSFAANASQLVSSSYIPLGNKSYSIDAWIYPTAFVNTYSTICGICTFRAVDFCLHLTVTFDGLRYYLYQGHYYDDLNSNRSPVPINKWIHTAFTFDVTTRVQTIYYNGMSLGNRTANNPFLGMTGAFQIGYLPNLTVSGMNNMFQGHIDELSVSNRVKTACEILDQATLAVRFSFDGSEPLSDQGPNSIPSNASNYVITNGRNLNGISFTSSSPSYLQASGFLALGIENQSFSISFWIKPASLAGTIVHQSNTSSTSGFCITYLGFASNGSLIAQVLTNTGYVGISYSNLSLTTFSHVVQTWSSTVGLRLYINNVLIATQTASTTVASSAWVNYMTIGSCFNGCGTCNAGQVSPGQFIGVIDDFRVYIRELSADDVCAAYAYGFT